MPRPPPPARALSITAAPSPSPSRNASASSTLTARLIPATSGTSRRSARARAAALSPNRSSTSACGPTKWMPARWQRRAIAVLGEETVARMDRLAALLQGQRDQPIHVEIGRHATAGQRQRDIGLAHVQGSGIVLGEHRHRADTQVGAGASDANGDLAAVGDQQGVEGSGHGRFSGSGSGGRRKELARRRVGHRRRHLRQPKEAAELRLIHRHP